MKGPYSVWSCTTSSHLISWQAFERASVMETAMYSKVVHFTIMSAAQDALLVIVHTQHEVP